MRSAKGREASASMLTVCPSAENRSTSCSGRRLALAAVPELALKTI
jgi:hypothetical protein